MKILIVGLCEKNCSLFKIKASEIVKILSKDNIFILGSERKVTIDFQIVTNLIKENKKTKIIMFYHDEKKKPFSLYNKNKLQNITFEYKKYHGNWNIARIPQILESDVIIMIGGDKGTEPIWYLADALNRPIVPIPCEYGISNKFWEHFKHKYKKEFNTMLLDTWEKDRSIFELKKIIKFLYRENKKEKGGIFFMLTMALLTLIILFMWGFLFFNSNIINSKIVLFILVFSSVILGVFLHNFINILDNKKLFFIKDVFIKIIIGFLISFMLFLLYFSGGFTINGNIDFLLKLNENDNFTRISIVMSSIGFFAGFFVESIKNKIENILMKVINE